MDIPAAATISAEQGPVEARLEWRPRHAYRVIDDEGGRRGREAAPPGNHGETDHDFEDRAGTGDFSPVAAAFGRELARRPGLQRRLAAVSPLHGGEDAGDQRKQAQRVEREWLKRADEIRMACAPRGIESDRFSDVVRPGRQGIVRCRTRGTQGGLHDRR